MLIEQLKGTPTYKQLLNVCVSLVSECFHQGNYKDGLWFLQGLSSVGSVKHENEDVKESIKKEEKINEQ